MNTTATLLLALAAAATPQVTRIDPPHWWTGMADSSLQLQVQGRNIRNADVTLAPYAGVTLDSVVRLDGSPDWLYLYLDVRPEAAPGTIELTFAEGRRHKEVSYQLRAREKQNGAQGFSQADVLYMIMPDRFADGEPEGPDIASLRFPVGADRTDHNVRHGGNLKGIADHLDYLDTLGVTAIWFNPVLENDMPGGSYHGYATTDYYRVDPRFGSNAEYRALVDTLHARGMKTVMDMIFNHCGSEHPWKLNPPSSDWFNFPDRYVQTNYRLGVIDDPYATEHDKRLATDGWFVEAMPDLNQRNPHLMKYLVQNSIWWIEEAQIDGIRMDTYPYADRAAMAGWVDAVLREYPQFNIVGECWFDQPALVSQWQRGSKLAPEGADSHLPTVMDFPFMILSRDLAPYREQTDPWHGLSRIYDHLGVDRVYADPANVLRFLDNHDTERMILEVPEDLGAWKQAQTILLTMPGIPQIYYGTELLMAGDRKEGDGAIRRDMPGGFPGDETDAFTAGGRTELQNEAYAFLSTLLNWRKGSRAVAEGRMTHYAPDGPLYVYRRLANDGSEAVVVLNGTDSPVEADLSRYDEIMVPGRTYRDILTRRTLVAGPVSLEPRCTLILEPHIK